MKNQVTRERFRKALPQALVMLREARGLSQAELSRRLDISSATMCRYEKGDYKPGVIRLAHILEVLGCDFGDLDDALKQVWAAEDEGVEPTPDLLLQSDATENEKLMAAYAMAAAHGQGDHLVERAIRQAQVLSRMRRYMQKYEKTWKSQQDEAKDAPEREEASPAESREADEADDFDEQLTAMAKTLESLQQ